MISHAAGYRTARAAYGIRSGATYCEVPLPADFSGHVRVGFSTERGDPEAGVGYDEWQYGIRDLDGAVFHNSKGRSFGEAFGPGDRIGAYIYLPEENARTKMRLKMEDPSLLKEPLAEIVREDDNFWAVRILADTPYSLPSSEVIRETTDDSFVAFFKNGKKPVRVQGKHFSYASLFRKISGGRFYGTQCGYILS